MERRYRVLLADDEQKILDTYGDFLRKRDFDVDSALDGNEAITKLRTGDFDVAILDLLMPGMNGLEVAKVAKDEDIETSLILLTGHGEKEDAVKAVNLHIDYWVQKEEVNMEDLLAKIRELAEGVPMSKIHQLMLSVPANDKS